MNQNSKKFLTQKELAERWGFAQSTMLHWRKNGRGPAHSKRGMRQIIYYMDDILEYEKLNPGLNPQ